MGISRRKLLIGSRIRLQHALLKKSHQQEVSGDGFVGYGVLIKYFFKILICRKLCHQLINEQSVDASHIGIFRIQLQSGGVQPGFADAGQDEVMEGNAVVLPCGVGIGFPVALVFCIDNAGGLAGEVIININHKGLHILRQLLQCTAAVLQHTADFRKLGLPIGLEKSCNLFFCSPCIRSAEVGSVQHIVVDELEVGILQGNHDLGLLDIFRIHIIVFRDL